MQENYHWSPVATQNGNTFDIIWDMDTQPEISATHLPALISAIDGRLIRDLEGRCQIANIEVTSAKILTSTPFPRLNFTYKIIDSPTVEYIYIYVVAAGLLWF